MNYKEIENKIINSIEYWLKTRDNAIPESSYYYYCFGIVQGLKLALKEINKNG